MVFTRLFCTQQESVTRSNQIALFSPFHGWRLTDWGIWAISFPVEPKTFRMVALASVGGKNGG